MRVLVKVEFMVMCLMVFTVADQEPDVLESVASSNLINIRNTV